MASNRLASIPSDAEICEILAHRIDVEGDGVGIVVGVIDAQGRRLISHGKTCQGEGRKPDGDTIFEIGSVTKAFTALALVEMAARGDVALDDPVAGCLPDGVGMPRRGGAGITLSHLASHTSGLPRSPSNLSPGNKANPYANYSVEQLYEFLGAYEMRREVGVTHLYSNLGAGLLGHALSLRAGLNFGALVQQRIARPLGMTSTGIELPREAVGRMAVGHDRNLRPVSDWDLPTLAGAGALRSTGNDLLLFLAAELGYDQTTLSAPMAEQLRPRIRTETRNLQALGWMISMDESGEIAWHNGGTGGFRCLLGFSLRLGRGVAVLTNCATLRGGDDIGFWALSGRPLLPRPVERRALTLSVAALDRCVGHYRFSPTSGMAVSRQGERLFFQLSGRGLIELFAESATDFFLRDVDAQVRFTVDSDGKVTGLVTKQSGQEQSATRVEDAGANP